MRQLDRPAGARTKQRGDGERPSLPGSHGPITASGRRQVYLAVDVRARSTASLLSTHRLCCWSSAKSSSAAALRPQRAAMPKGMLTFDTNHSAFNSNMSMSKVVSEILTV
jgi:hypothetical protein